jgi:spermidine synthase
VIPRELIAVAEVPGGPPLQLVRHGGDFMITLERNELMSTRMSGSEVALGAMTCQRLRTPSPNVLIGGYGMGFTLRAVLAELGPAARITVAELVPEIVEWARGPMAAMTNGCLDDPRVEIRIGDVAGLIDPRAATWDAILLDVDNGPDGLVRDANDRIYTLPGLKVAKAALRPGGVLAVWSAAKDTVFANRLRKAGFAVDEVSVRARAGGADGKGKGPQHTIWFAARG